MKNILQKIFEKKQEELAKTKLKTSFEEVYKFAKESPKTASFADALKTKNGVPAIIAELKKASPSMGLIRKNFEPKELAKSLELAGAAALSVLTEEQFFLGKKEYLIEAKKSVKIPILRKDFIFDKYQLCEAKAWGASAALLIVAMLEKENLKELLDFAKSIELEILVETHSEEELEIALECGAKIIGVNSRNLKTFEFDYTLFSKLISKTPSGCIAVAESGVESRTALIDAGKVGASAALIGTAFMSKDNPADELKKFLEV